ncbi:MAG: Fructose-bisphosphate aldolase class I, partial [uncultured Rubrobacteraceae bacterium]
GRTTARAHREGACAHGQGPSRRRRELRHDRQALRGGRHRGKRGGSPAVPGVAAHHRGRRRVPLRGNPLRRDHPPEYLGWQVDGRSTRGAGHYPRDQGGQEHRGPAPCPRREVHPGPGRLGREARGVRGDGRALHQVAGGYHHRRRNTNGQVRRVQRPRPRPLRGVLAGSRPRARGRARGPHRRGSLHRALLRGQRVGAAQHLQGHVRAGGPPRRDAPQAELRHQRQGRRRAGAGRGRRPVHHRVLYAQRAGCGARHRPPLRRPERRGRDRAPERDEEHVRDPPVGDLLLLGPGAAGQADGDLGRRRAERRGSPKGLPPPRQDGLRRRRRQLLQGDGTGAGRV